MWEIDGEIIRARQLSVLWQWFGYTAACRWGQLYYTPDDGFRDDLKRHELAHLWQQLKQSKYIIVGYPIFCIKYAWEWTKLLFAGKRPYEDNPFEREARAKENVFQGWKEVTKNSYKNYRV